MIKKYRKKPVEVEALQVTEKNYCDLARFVNNPDLPFTTKGGVGGGNGLLEDIFLPGRDKANVGDYIIKEQIDKREYFYVCSPDTFKKTYEEIKDENEQ